MISYGAIKTIVKVIKITRNKELNRVIKKNVVSPTLEDLFDIVAIMSEEFLPKYKLYG